MSRESLVANSPERPTPRELKIEHLAATPEGDHVVITRANTPDLEDPYYGRFFLDIISPDGGKRNIEVYSVNRPRGRGPTTFITPGGLFSFPSPSAEGDEARVSWDPTPVPPCGLCGDCAACGQILDQSDSGAEEIPLVELTPMNAEGYYLDPETATPLPLQPPEQTVTVPY